MQAEAARLDEELLAATEELFDVRLDLGQAAELVAPIERLLAAEPLRERLTAQLMFALYRSGRQTDALAVYAATTAAFVEQFVAHLSEVSAQGSLGIPPTVQALIGSRIDGLPPTRAILLRVSVLGGSFEFDEVSALARTRLSPRSKS